MNLSIGRINLVTKPEEDAGVDPIDQAEQPQASALYQRRIDDYVKFIYSRSDRNVRSNANFQSLKKHMEWVYGRQTVLFCVDVEAWERNTQVVTEIGVSIYDPEEQENALTPVIRTYHIVIDKNQNKRNGRFVPDHMNNFMEGTSVLLPMYQAKTLLQKLVDKYFGQWATKWCTLVGHDLRNDIDYLAKIGIHVPPSCLQLDTQKVFAYSHGSYGASLQNALRTVKQPFAFLHNAANDAYFTVMLALKLCDPNARLALGLDILAAGENVGDRKEYTKLPTNTSVAVYTDPEIILRELSGQI
ncbi:hypothetical protein JCM33374_g3821 [Metschnikowia sp. JCM 33374]|nr:hypothetical protein JCM33374_g3821 [Metschnikowia sp. JCM 33374]